jgi:hypothetical protein
MIILFGSYARGNWVDDTCTKGHITYEYISDFDVLAIVETNKIANSTNLWRRLDKSINAMHLLTPVTIIAHDINFVNRKLKNGLPRQNALISFFDATEFERVAVKTFNTNYKPKSHDLGKLSRLAANYDKSFFDVFPQGTKQEKDCFDLLNRAYVEARYDPDYKITKKQLEYLAARVRKLQKLTKTVCKKKIESYV